MSLLNDGHRYSYSQLSQFDECPYSFYLGRIEKLPQTQNAFSQMGSLVHDLIDLWAKGKVAIEDLPYEYIKRYPQEVTEQWPKFLAAKRYAEKAYHQGLNYFQTFDGFDGYKILATEEKFETTIAGRRFVGVIDMRLLDEVTDEQIICDHKSKSLSAFKKAEDSMYLQQLLYSKYVHEQFGIWPDRMMFNLFKENGVKKERPFTVEAFEKAEAWAGSVMDKIESFDVLDWLETKDSDFFCQELCGLRQHCPNGKLPKRKSHRRNNIT